MLYVDCAIYRITLNVTVPYLFRSRRSAAGNAHFADTCSLIPTRMSSDIGQSETLIHAHAYEVPESFEGTFMEGMPSELAILCMRRMLTGNLTGFRDFAGPRELVLWLSRILHGSQRH